jgi:hypothetical protein
MIADADGRDSEGVAKVHRQLRNLEAKELIAPSGKAIDARGTVVFDEVEACRARLLCVLTDLGFDAQLLRQASDRMSPPANSVHVSRVNGRKIETPHWDDPWAADNQISKLPLAVRDRNSWMLELRLMCDRGGFKSISGGFNPPLLTTEQERDVAKVYEFQGISVQAVVRLPASKLVAPIVQAFAD